MTNDEATFRKASEAALAAWASKLGTTGPLPEAVAACRAGDAGWRAGVEWLLKQVTGAANPWANVRLGAGGLTLEQQATNAETWKHINTVMRLLEHFKALLAERQFSHDRSKLVSPEVQTFTEFTPKLAGATYGSEEYKGYLAAMKPALDHHYASNRHHPEHHEEGIDGMTLVDLVEMFIDWKAATLRHDDGDLTKSIAINQKRFGYSDQLRRIFENTGPLLEGVV